MGTTANSIHVWCGLPDVADQVGPLVRTPAYLSGPAGGWVTVWPQDQSFGLDPLAQRLSAELDRPVVDFFIFDSDVAAATLVLMGSALDQIVLCHEGLLDEMGWEEPLGPRVRGVESDMEVRGNLSAWTSTLGVSEEDVLAAANRAESGSPFVEDLTTSLLGAFGLDAHRLQTAYGFIDNGDEGLAGLGPVTKLN
jgi:hypothetical protein